MRGGAGGTWAGLLAILLVGTGCAGGIARTNEGYRPRGHGYTIAAPNGPGAPWKRVDVDGARLTFRPPGPESLSLLSRCGRPVAAPQLMARHLLIGLGEREFVSSAPLEVAGHSGWSQVFETTREGVRVRVKTVTLVVGRCAFDWVLASAGSFETAEAAFDAWWESSRLDPRHHAEVGS